MSNLSPRINRLETNLVIDGAMEIWPEGTSRTVINNTASYGSVLMSLNNSSSGVTLTNSRQSAVPSGSGLVFSNQTSKTAAGTLSVGTSVTKQHIIEGYNIQNIINQEFSLVFWVRSSVASNRSLAIRNGSATHSFVKQYSINSANTWELKAINFPALSTCPGVLDRTNGLGLRVTWNIVSGSTFQTSSLNQWLSGNFVSGVGENTTWLTGTTHSFDIAGIMCLPGDWTGLNAAGYEFVRAGRNFAEEVGMSQRYYEKSYEFNTAPGAATSSGTTGWRGFNGNPYNSQTFAVVKRAAPVIRLYDWAGNIDRIRTNNTNNITLNGSIESQTSGFTVIHNTTVTEIFYQWTADARF